MAVTWDVVSLEGTTKKGDLSDVVTCIHWNASDADGDHTGLRYGFVGLADPDSNSFTAYKDITKENAILWVKAALGAEEVTAIETNIAEQITESKTPTKFNTVPWS
tara:strand:- start:68 stop:385 length:318 start_codon:yes stop_codon:yes gene_type:complete